MSFKEIFLDDSVLDIDAWLPDQAVDEIVQSLLEQENLNGE